MTVYRHTCVENHTGPPEGRKIGEVAGWRVFGGFCDEGGYGVDQSVIDAVVAIETEYQQNVYLPLQAEADGIYEWLDTTQVDDGTWLIARAAKTARLHGISAEADAAWYAAADAARALVGEDAYNTFLDAHALLP